MARVIVAKQAKRDLRQILSDLNERAGYRVAATYTAEFKATYRHLAICLIAISYRSELTFSLSQSAHPLTLGRVH